MDGLRVEKRRPLTQSQVGKPIPIRPTSMFGSPRDSKGGYEASNKTDRSYSEGHYRSSASISTSSSNSTNIRANGLGTVPGLSRHQRTRSLLNNLDNENVSYEMLRRYGMSNYADNDNPTATNHERKSSWKVPFQKLQEQLTPKHDSDESFRQFLDSVGQTVRGDPQRIKEQILSERREELRTQKINCTFPHTPTYGNLPSRRYLDSEDQTNDVSNADITSDTTGDVTGDDATFAGDTTRGHTSGMNINMNMNMNNNGHRKPSKSSSRRLFSERLREMQKGDYKARYPDSSLDNLDSADVTYDTSSQNQTPDQTMNDTLNDTSSQNISGNGSISQHMDMLANVINATSTNEDWIDEDELLLKQRRAKKRKRNAGAESSSLTTVAQTQQRGFFLDPMAPGILSAYIQTIFNFTLLAVFIYFFFLIVFTVRHDIQLKAQEHRTAILQEMTQCTREYTRNKCGADRRPPALEQMCLEWEECFSQDPSTVGHARISAETFAEILNGFIEPISVKSMLFVVFICAGAFLVNNLAFGINTRRYLSTVQSAANIQAESRRRQLEYLDSGPMLLQQSQQGHGHSPRSEDGVPRKIRTPVKSIAYRHLGTTRSTKSGAKSGAKKALRRASFVKSP